MALAVSVHDDCGSPVTAGSVTVNFSTGDPPLSLQSLRDGTWHATWQTRRESQSAVTLKVNATSAQFPISGTTTIAGTFGSPKDPPVFSQGSIAAAATPTAFQPLAPGSIISVFGDRLADGTLSAERLPLPTQLGNTQVVIQGQTIPLIFVSQTQINALVPNGLSTNTTHQLLVLRGDTYSEPAPINVAAAQPNVFSSGGYGVIFAARSDGTPPFLVTSSAPARAGDILVLYCAGLGATNPSVPDGVGSPANPPAQTREPVAVSIGGRSAEVLYAGLVADFVGLYQVNVVVPAGVAAGDAVPVTLSTGGMTGVSVPTVIR